VSALGVLVLGYGTFFRLRADRARDEHEERTLARWALAADTGIVAYAMVVFSPDPLWTTFILGAVVILIGTFRFGAGGALATTLAMSLAFVGTSVLRDRAFGLAFEPDRAAFHLGFFVLTALVASGMLSELHRLRRQREDVARRVIDAREARLSADRLRAVLDSALDAVIGMSADGHIIEWNPQARVMFGWSRAEVIGTQLAEMIIPERYREAHRNGLARYLATGEGPVLGKRVELEALRRDGTEIPIELSIVAIEDEERRTFSAFIRDLTERRRLDAAARRAIEREEAARALATVLARMSHELRTPLNAILGFSDLLAEQAGPVLQEKQRRYLENIRTSGKHLLRLVDELLGIAKREGGPPAA
jgi:PAS domain S-box-containing protein